MPRSTDTIAQYLNRYSETDAIAVAGRVPEGSWEFAVALPLCGEYEGVFPLIESIGRAAVQANARVLVIALINARRDHPAEILRANQRLWELWSDGVTIGTEPPARFTQKDLSILAVSRTFETKQGVGLARKFVLDAALSLFHKQCLLNPIVLTTDGDAQIDPNTFSLLRAQQPRGVGCFLFHYLHDVDKTHAALSIYELSLRYYRLGLAHAGSPCAFHTLGSTLAIPLSSYAEVRGFPDLQAAEDFYILSKLAKVGEIRSIPGTIHLMPRTSDRVPFGTGVGTAGVQAWLDEGREPEFYAPASFEILKTLMQSLAKIVDASSPETIWNVFLNNSAENRALAMSVAKQRGLHKQLEIAFATRPRPEDRLRHMHTWFDAFHTLKWIHALRDGGLPKIPWRRALRENSFLQIDDAACPFLALEHARRIDLSHYGLLYDPS